MSLERIVFEMYDIIFIISHRPDVRYRKRLELLSSCYKVALVYWNKNKNKEDFSFDGIDIYEFHIPSHRSNPLKRVPQTLLFCCKVTKLLKDLCSRFLYVGNLDMLFIAAKYKKKHPEVKIYYEIADLHRLIIDTQNTSMKKAVSFFLKRAEKALIKYVDKLVVTSRKFYTEYYCDLIEMSNVLYMPNMPQNKFFSDFVKKEHGEFTIGFVGVLRYEQQLQMLIDATDELGIHVVIAGESLSEKDYRKHFDKYDHVEYLGGYDFKRDIKNIYAIIDVIYSVYDASMKNVRLALPNKLYEATLCEIPIIVADQTYLAEIVRDHKIGVAVGFNDKNALKRVLYKLKNDRSFYNSFVEGCRSSKSLVDMDYYNNLLLKSFGGWVDV